MYWRWMHVTITAENNFMIKNYECTSTWKTRKNGYKKSSGRYEFECKTDLLSSSFIIMHVSNVIVVFS